MEKMYKWLDDILKNEYKCEIELTKPKIASRETIKKKSDVSLLIDVEH